LCKQVDGLHGPVTLHSGRSWLPFREEFYEQPRPTRQERTIIIAHGGTDPYRLTVRSLEALQLTSEKWTVVVLATNAFRDLGDVHRAAAKSKHECTVLVDSKNVAEWMRKATVAIINGGNVRYELCVTGTPFVAIAFQPQQYVCTEQIASLGAGVNLGEMNKIDNYKIACAVENLISDPAEINRMREVMQTLFDEKGCGRILDLILGETVNE